MSAKRFTLMGYVADGSWPTVKAVQTVDPVEVLETAQTMLAESPRCERVEVWSDSEILHTLRRPAKT